LFAASARLKVLHGFFGRRGGVSAGPFYSLNAGLSPADEKENVIENRRRVLAEAAPGAELTLLRQVHGSETLEARAWESDDPPEGDALVTDRPGRALAILTADCAPVLLADVGAGVIGAAHAGWKGAFSGVIESVVAAMEGLGARREHIAAAIGPCIARASYEVDAAFHRRFLEADPRDDGFFMLGREDHFQFDLEAFVAARLALAGVGNVEALGIDTYGAAEDYFSFRRATHRGETPGGRQISLIALPG